MLSLRSCGKMNGGIMIPLLLTIPNIMIWIGHLVFITIGTLCGDRASHRSVCEFTIWFWPKFFSSERNRIMCGCKRRFSLFKTSPVKKIGYSHLAGEYEKFWMSSSTTCLIRNVSGYRSDWSAGIFDNHGLNHNNQFGSFFLSES